MKESWFDRDGKRIGVLIVIICLIMLVAWFVYKGDAEADKASMETDKAQVDMEALKSEAAGIIVCGLKEGGRIKNTNLVALRVEKIYYNSDYGPIAVWIDIIEPQEEKKEYIHERNGFIIYTMTGIKIGIIPPLLSYQ